MPQTIRTIILVLLLAVPAVATAELQLSLEPVRVELDPEFDDEPLSMQATSSYDRVDPEGWQLTGTWALSGTLDVSIAWHDLQARPRSPVIALPYVADYSARGYTVGFEQHAFGPFELFGRVGMMDVQVDDANYWKRALDGNPDRIAIAGGGARWRPTGDAWGFEAGANRATGRPTFVGVGWFITF